MSKKITYLLGAGASANAIPIVSEMHERMKEMSAYFLKILKKYADAPIVTQVDNFNQDLYNYLEVLDGIYNKIEWLIGVAGNYYSIDTLAKKFYLTGAYDKLDRLKETLIIYFTLEQILLIPSENKGQYNFVKNPIDKRYGNFIAGITRKTYPVSQAQDLSKPHVDNFGFELNPNVSVLSWNYDMQFEISVRSLLTSTIINHIKGNFQILPNQQSKNQVNNIPIVKNKFAMVKLNGDASWDCTQDKRFNISIFDGIWRRDTEERILIDYLKKYVEGNITTKNEPSRHPSTLFNFAWESDVNFSNKYAGHLKNLEAAEQIASETEVLVVIGYSFPVFNREIDKRIFDKMTNLQKVYVQDINPVAIVSTMRNAFKVLQEKKQVEKVKAKHLTNSGNTEIIEYAEEDKVELLQVNNTNQFMIPYELT